MALLPLLLMVPILGAVAYFDLRYMRIPNILSLIALTLFVVTIPAIGVSEACVRALAASVVFTIGIAGFALRLLGGGDVKFFAVLVAFIPSQSWALYMLVFSASLAIGIVGIQTWRTLPRLRGTGWVSAKAPGTFPMGISIAMSGVAHFYILASMS